MTQCLKSLNTIPDIMIYTPYKHSLPFPSNVTHTVCIKVESKGCTKDKKPFSTILLFEYIANQKCLQLLQKANSEVGLKVSRHREKGDTILFRYDDTAHIFRKSLQEGILSVELGFSH